MDFTTPVGNLVTQERQINLISTNLGNRFIKPLLFRTTDIEQSENDKFNSAYITTVDAKSALSTSVFATVTMESEAYEIENYDTKTKSWKKATIPSTKLDLGTVLIDVRMSKNVVTTPINGLDGTVKEYISDGDYQVSLRGALVKPFSYEYPFEDYKKLNDILKAKSSIKVVSEFLSFFPVHSIVVMDYTIPQKEGTSNTQLFEINCISDNPIDILKIN